MQDSCTTTWYTGANGRVSALGSCTSLSESGNYKYADNKLNAISCNGNDCNNVLICFTGTRYLKASSGGGGHGPNTFQASLCNFDKNQVCQTTVTWSPVYGYAFTGQCQAQGVCESVTPSFTNDAKTRVTFCCTSQYCNSIKNGFQFSASSLSSSSSSKTNYQFLQIAFLLFLFSVFFPKF